LTAPATRRPSGIAVGTEESLPAEVEPKKCPEREEKRREEKRREEKRREEKRNETGIDQAAAPRSTGAVSRPDSAI
jgi:hypothetical protein